MRSASSIVLLAGSVTLSLAAQQREISVSPDKAAALGAYLAANARRQTTPLVMQAVDEYLTALGRLLAAEIPNAPAHWEFTVVQQPGNWAHEPLGLPGGYVFVPAALITAADDEAEFASMLAHSMAHAASPAAVRWNGASVPLLFPDTDPGLRSDGSALVPVSLRAGQQERELKADATAAAAISHGGFDARALIPYLNRAQSHLQSQAELTGASERLARLRETLATPLPGAYLRLSSSSFAAIQARVREEEQARTKPPKVPSLVSPSR